MRVAGRQTLLVAMLLLLTAATVGAAEPDWNDADIEWKDYEEGMNFVEILGKPGVLVFYTNWCPHCVRYSQVFHDPEVVELSKRFVMIRVDRDREKRLNERYADSGAYVPRTLFLKPSGRVDWRVGGARPDYPHFLETRNPAELLAIMRSQASEAARAAAKAR